MHCNVTISSEEFKTIHNGLCDLRVVVNRLEGVLSPELYSLLLRAKNEIRKGLDGAYAQEQRSFESKNTHYNDVAKARGLRSSWSMFEVNDLNAVHPYEGATHVSYVNHWGPKPIKMPITGNTWADLYSTADECIRCSGDDHHIFIENFKRDDDVLLLSTGS